MQLEDVVGLEDASGYIRVVGQLIGEKIDTEYKNAIALRSAGPFESGRRPRRSLKRRIDQYMLGLTHAFIRGWLSALWRRVTSGPTLPSWGLRLEVAVSVLRSILDYVGTLELDQASNLPKAKARLSGPVRDLRFEEVRGAVAGSWVRPHGGDGKGTLLYLHGGGYIGCSVATHLDLVARLVKAGGFNAFSLEYRLAPEHPFPAAVEDAVAAYQWLLTQQVDPAELVVAGDSAGGGLTAALLLSLRDQSQPLPAGAGLVSPWIDLTDDSPSLLENARSDYLSAPMLDVTSGLYAGTHSRAEPLISPALGSLEGLPPLLVQVGGGEILRDQDLAFAAKAESAGVEVELRIWPEMPHVWHALAAFDRRGQAATEELAAFLRQQLDRRNVPRGTEIPAGVATTDSA